jgi:hypothetical protein
VVVSGGSAGASWLDEGLSIIAEELGSTYYEKKCPPPSCRTDPAQIFPDSAEGFVQSFLYDSYQYALLPDTASVTLHDDSEDGFSWRGGAWLLMRWLGDQLGSGVYQKLEHGTAGGVADIEQATCRVSPAPRLRRRSGSRRGTSSNFGRDSSRRRARPRTSRAPIPCSCSPSQRTPPRSRCLRGRRLTSGSTRPRTRRRSQSALRRREAWHCRRRSVRNSLFSGCRSGSEPAAALGPRIGDLVREQGRRIFDDLWTRSHD